MIHSFLPLLYMLPHAAVGEVHCSIPQPCMHGFLAFHVVLVVVAICVTFNISDTWYSGWSVSGHCGGWGQSFHQYFASASDIRHAAWSSAFSSGSFQLGTCHKVHITVSGACECSEWHFLFLPLCNKPLVMNLLESQTSRSHNFMDCGYDCGILLSDCYVMPFHILFWGRNGGTSIHDHF